MKKFIFLLPILLMAMFVTSCSNDDDENNEFASSLTVNGNLVKITNLEGNVPLTKDFELWINDATSDFYVQGVIKATEAHTSGKDVTKDCRMTIALVNNEEWYNTEIEYVSGSVIIEKWDLENFKVTLAFKDYKCTSGSNSIVLNGSVTFPTSINLANK